MTTTTIRAVSALLLGCFLALGAAAQPRFDFDRTPGHLPKSVVPTHYRLTLHLDPQAEVFSGEALISVRVRQPVPAIVLHAHELVASAAVLEQGGSERGLTVHGDESTQTWRLVPTDAQPIAPGEYRLRLAYSGKVNRSGAALYQAPHQVQGQPARMLATQLEAIFARRVFPGFDEPAFRIAFDLAVRAPQGYEVLSNMPATSRVDDGGPGGSVLHRFATTPPMPSYLLAVAVGRFDMLHGSAAGVPLRIVTAPGKREQAAYAMASTQTLLPYFNDYFGVPYALPKLDQIAVPSTRGGAMEDWGLISYAEQHLLFDPASSDTQTRQGIFRIVAHEVAHQWFGNLVTAASWEEIWLNEAFATWLAAKAMERFNPEWQTRLSRRQWIDFTMVRDAGPATRAIRSGAVSEDSVFDVFDGITYTKGGAVLSMLEQWIGPDSFRRGLAGYMRAQQYSNATAGDLWFHIGKASNRDIAAVAASWTDQPGFPLVSVTSRCEGGRTHVELRQRRFSTDGAESPALWQIPLVLLHGNKRSTYMLRSERQTLLLPGCPAQPLLLNAGGEGFYRVAYAAPQQAALVRSFARLPDSARITLLSDTFALAQAGQLPMAAFLELLAEVPKAQGAGRSALYAQARSGLDFLAGAFAGTPQQAALESAARALFAPELASLGWTPKAGESSETESLRNLLIEDLARYGDTAVLERARALFDAEQAGGAALPPGIRAGVMRAVGVQPGNARFEQLWARLLATASEEERSLYASALAEVRDPALAQRLLALSLQGTLPTNQASQLPGLVAERRHNAEMAYRFTLSNWPALAELAGPVERVWLLPGAAEGFNRREQAQALLADQQRLAGVPGASPAARIAARIELQAAVQSREASAVDAELRRLTQRLALAGR